LSRCQSPTGGFGGVFEILWHCDVYYYS
jgi:hypothetical protein